jgi:nicotinate-nucleotide pyrophosphorylase (carboxylating)
VSADAPRHPPDAAVREAVARALAEDLGPAGDVTASLVPADARGRARFVARAAGVLAGRHCAEATFAEVDPAVEVAWELDDGDALVPGAVIASVSGSLRSILAAERTSLNFLCHLSGVASLTRRFAEAVTRGNPRARVRDTRKTTPGLRLLEKAAVRAGGGVNHRFSLSDGVLLKDNHLAGVGIADAVRRAREQWPGLTLEVECDRFEQVEEALAVGAPMVLLDNMGPAEVAGCVEAIRAGREAVVVEVSGGVSLETATALAAAGADFVSVGSITHSAPALDIGLDLEG